MRNILTLANSFRRWRAPACSALLTSAFCLLPFLTLALPQAPTAPSAFDEWLAALRAEALARGISPATVDLALTNLVPEPVILARDRMQPETTQSLDAYLADRLRPKIIAKARAQAAEHADLLDRVRLRYGVPGPVMISIWAAESNFGQFTGVRPIVPALATLAYDPRRPALFRSELFEALTILDRGLVPIGELKGSWAGAMGQPQFMPSSYLKYAVDFDGDGRADIWKSEPDVFASMANYLKRSGWVEDERWGREVRVPRAAMTRIDRSVTMQRTGCRARREMTEWQPLAKWTQLGVTLPGGGALPAANLTAALVRGRQRNFLVYRNYQAILDYNCSNAYAVSIGLLADRIGTN